MYLRTKFEASSIVLTGFRLGTGNSPPPPTPHLKTNPKKPTQIRVNMITRRNESKIITKDKSCKCKRRFDGKNM